MRRRWDVVGVRFPVTTIVLVTIGIILAAVSAMMVFWYGGTAFDNGRINADAARLLTEGSQIERAVGLYRAQEGRTPDIVNKNDPLAALVDRRYLADRPSGDNGRWFVDYPSGMIRADVGAVTDTRAVMVCRAARRSQKLFNPAEVYRCDGSDYPMPHPAGGLPAVEPCCVWSGATDADIGGGRGSSASSPSPTPPPTTGGGTGGGTQPDGYNPVGSTNTYSVDDRVDFLARSFDAIQKGTKAFYLKYHQISTMSQMVAMGYIPGWALTSLSGDYGTPSVQTTWSQTPWPGGIYADKPYVHVYLNEDLFSAFAEAWRRRHGTRSNPDNYYGNHLSERIYLPLFPTNVSTIVAAFKQSDEALASFRSSRGFLPRRLTDLVGAGILTGMPTSGFGVISEDYAMLSRSAADAAAQNESRAVVMPLASEEACRTYNLKLYGVDEVPEWASRDAGCALVGGSMYAYSYVAGEMDPSTWYPYDEMSKGNPSAHFVYTTSQPDKLQALSANRIAMAGYTFWAFSRQNRRLVLHPGVERADTITLRFKAPDTGAYRLSGVWQPMGGCGNGVDLSVSGLGTRYGDSSQPWVFDFVRTLSAGQTVDFTLGNRGSDLCDGTYLDLTAVRR